MKLQAEHRSLPDNECLPGRYRNVAPLPDEMGFVRVNLRLVSGALKTDDEDVWMANCASRSWSGLLLRSSGDLNSVLFFSTKSRR